MLDVQNSIPLFTVDEPQGYRISEYIGVVSGQAIVGANFVRDYFARIVDKVGGRAGGWENAQRAAIRAATKQVLAEAAGNGANAVVGVRISCQVAGSMLCAVVFGTAVRLRPVSDVPAEAPFAGLQPGQRYLHPEPLG
jgi:uncharacterized protein YbjQ (UPF0145 family)